jgi:hypothetical protein
VVAVVLLIITGGVVVWQVLIPHDGDGSAWWSGVYTDRQVEETVQESVWGVEIFLLDSGLGKESPKRRIGVLHFGAKPRHGRAGRKPTSHFENFKGFQFFRCWKLTAEQTDTVWLAGSRSRGCIKRHTSLRIIGLTVRPTCPCSLSQSIRSDGIGQVRCLQLGQGEGKNHQVILPWRG